MSRARLFLTVGWGLVLCAPLGIGLAALSGIGHRWVDILAQFVGPAMFGTVLMLLAASLWRARMETGVAAVVALVLLAAGAPQWFPARGTPEAGSADLTLYSANVWALNEDVDAIARSVKASDADLVVLVELGDVAAARLDEIIGDYPYRFVGIRRAGPKGAARFVFASRGPVAEVKVSAEQLDAQGAEAETPLGPITVVAVHLTRPWPYQFQWGQIIQARGLTNWRRERPGPMIVAGDFNSVSSARIGRQIKSETGMIPAPGWPGTWHSALPSVAAMTIDQVYRTPDLALVDRKLGTPNGSDHRPVITRFRRAASPTG